MSNRLEHEFPAARWHDHSSRGVQHHHLVRASMVRGRRMQATAIRRAARAALAAAARLIRYGAYGIAKRPLEQDCGSAARNRA
jgi:hypothetical protein